METTTPQPLPPPPAFVKKKRKKLSPAQRRMKIRDEFWPAAANEIWNRHENDGFVTIPRLLPLICALIKHNAKNDPTRVYLDLWCRVWDEGVIAAIDEDEAAFSSGYLGTRARRTWIDHINQLVKLGFIRTVPHANSEIGHVLIRNPLIVVEELRSKPKSKVTPEWWSAYIKRASEVGAVLPSDEE